MKDLLLENMTWPEIRQAMDDGYDTVVIFAASIEQHGPALPEVTDTALRTGDQTRFKQTSHGIPRKHHLET